MQRYDSYKDSGVKWLGEIPSHWEVNKAKYYLYSKKAIVGKYSANHERLALTLNGVIKRQDGDDIGLNPEKLDTYQIVESGNLIFKLIDLENFKTSRVGLTPYNGIVSPAYIRLINKGDVNMRFLEYYYLNMWHRKVFNDLGTPGVRSNLSANDLLNLCIVLPNVNEQDAIVSYLDTATAKIDAAIAQQQKMIDLLNERKQIIINRAVTKGLNPNAKMKDSGVEWIGEVPEEWEVRRIKYILRESNVRSIDGHETSYSLSKSKGLIPFSDKDNLTQARFNNVGAKIVKPGEIVFNRFKARLFAVSNVEAAVSPDYAIYQKIAKCDLHYLVYLFGTKLYRGEFDRIAQGVGDGFSRLYTEDLFSIYAIFPNENEQRQIVGFIRKNTEKIDLAIIQCENTISLLQERKQIIINEVVTGKVKVYETNNKK